MSIPPQRPQVSLKNYSKRNFPFCPLFIVKYWKRKPDDVGQYIPYQSSHWAIVLFNSLYTIRTRIACELRSASSATEQGSFGSTAWIAFWHSLSKMLMNKGNIFYHPKQCQTCYKENIINSDTKSWVWLLKRFSLQPFRPMGWNAKHSF